MGKCLWCGITIDQPGHAWRCGFDLIQVVQLLHLRYAGLAVFGQCLDFFLQTAALCLPCIQVGLVGFDEGFRRFLGLLLIVTNGFDEEAIAR